MVVSHRLALVRYLLIFMATSTDNQSLIERLFKAGAHFGFKKSRRHPSVAPYLFTTKDGNDIFDLEKTSVLLGDAAGVMKEAGVHGKTVLFVGTKEEISPLVHKAATTTEMPFVTNRWIGGMLTNLSEIKKRIARLETLQHEQQSGELERKYIKKERVVIGREIEKLTYNFGGIQTMQKMPDLMVVVDPRHDNIAIAEAKEMKVPVVAVLSSDCDASQIDYPVVVNDALQESVSLALTELTTAYNTGKAEYTPRPATTPARR